MGFLLQATPCTFGRNSFKTLGVKVFLSSRVSDGVLNFLSFSTSSWFNATWCTNLKSRSPSCPSSFTALMISAAHFTRDTVFPQIVSTMCFFSSGVAPGQRKSTKHFAWSSFTSAPFFSWSLSLVGKLVAQHWLDLFQWFHCEEYTWFSQQIFTSGLGLACHEPGTPKGNEGLREVVKVPKGWLVAYAHFCGFHLYLTHCTSSMYSWQHPTQLLIDSPGGWSGYFRRLANKIDSSFSPTYQNFEATPNNKRGNLYNL